MNGQAIPIEAARRRRREVLLEIEGLGKVFVQGGKDLTVIQGFDLRVERGEFICILGRSGCGKSTLLKMVAGFTPPSTGSILLQGKPISGAGPDRCVVFQEDTLFPWLTVEENIAFGLRGRGSRRRAVRREVDRYLDIVGLHPFRHYLPVEISGGMKQRVALARVLILKPQILLMDEPFGALDAQTRDRMQEFLLELWERLGHTILFVTHDVAEAVSIAGRVLVMGKDPGRVQAEVVIDLSRPRSRETAGFIDVCRRLRRCLESA